MTTEITLTTTLLQLGNNVGIPLTDEQLASLGRGKRVPVIVALNGYRYASTTAQMGGRNLIGVSAAVRRAAGVAGGETHEITLQVDDAPRTVEAPAELAEAFAAEPALAAAWQQLAPSRQKEHARSIAEAKAADTRARRVEKTLEALRGA
jgi:hypothetical protein